MVEAEHRMEVRFDRDHVRVEMVCHAPEGADCRLIGPPGCTCDSWTIERAHEAAEPFHRVDTIGGAEILHWMHDGGECNVALWINEGGDIAELNAADEAFLIASIPVEPVWQGDHYGWKRAKK